MVIGYWLLIITIYQLPITSYQLPVSPIRSYKSRREQKTEDRGQKTEDGSSVLCPLFSVFRLLSLLPPVVRVPNGVRPNVELSAQHFYQRFCPFYLKIGWGGGFVIGYDADINSLVGWCLAKIRWPLVF